MRNNFRNGPSYFNGYPPFEQTYRGTSPFSPPRMGVKDIVTTKKPLTFKKALTNAEKGIDTISSMIPIYQKVKPIVTNGKDFVNVIKKKLVKSDKKVEHVEAELVDDEKEVKEERVTESKVKEKYQEEKEPNKPFMI